MNTEAHNIKDVIAHNELVELWDLVDLYYNIWRGLKVWYWFFNKKFNNNELLNDLHFRHSYKHKLWFCYC